MKPCMICWRADQQILGTVVKFVTIDVMNNLSASEGAAKYIFCNSNMFIHSLVPLTACRGTRNVIVRNRDDPITISKNGRSR